MTDARKRRDPATRIDIPMPSLTLPPMRDIRATIAVPIFNVTVKLAIVDDAPKEMERLWRYTGGQEMQAGWAAAVFQCANRFALVGHRDQCSDDVIAHELYHLTNGILAMNNIEIDADDDEVGALLTQYLHSWVWKQIKKHAPLDRKQKAAKVSG